MEFFSGYFDVLQPFITFLLCARLCPFIYRRLSRFSIASTLRFSRKYFRLMKEYQRQQGAYLQTLLLHENGHV